MAKIGLDLRFWRSSTGGLGRYSRNLLTELLKIDHENQYTAIITPQDEPEFNLRAPNLKKLVVDIGHYSLEEQTRLPKILKQENFDLVHFANFNHPIRYRGRFVITLHDMIMHLYPPPQSWIRRKAYRLTVRDCKRAQKVIVPSQSTKTDLIKMLKFPAAKIVVTQEGSEALFRLHSDREKIALKDRLKLPKHFLLFVSRWERYKGLPELIVAFEMLRDKHPDLGLVVCGKPVAKAPDVADYLRLKQEAGLKIITPGFVSEADLAALYAAADAYVHPSWYEGFGIMILEAMASGTPVVTSNISSLPEVVGEAGLLVDPKKPEEIATAIQKILDDPKLAEDLRQKGLARVKDFSWKKMAEETLTVYQDILNAKK